MFFEHNGFNIRQINNHINNGEANIGEFLRHLLHRRRLGKTDAHNRISAALRQTAHGLFTLSRISDFKLAIINPGLFLEAFGAIVRCFVKRLIELATHIENNSGRIIGGQSNACGKGQAQYE